MDLGGCLNTNTRSKILVGLWVSVAGVSLAIIVAWIYQVATQLGTPYNFDYGESWNVWVGNWIGNGGLAHIYYPYGQEPYYQTFYTPVFYLVLGPLFWLFSPSLLVGRLASVSACLLSSVIVFLLIKQITKSKWYSLLGGLLFLVPPLTRVWSEFIHVDTLGVTFSLLGMYVFIRGNNTKKSLWAVIPFLLGIFTKQVFIVAPLAVILYLLISKRWKLVSQFTGLMVVGGTCLVGLFQWWSGGNFIEAIFTSPTVFKVHWQLSVYLTNVFVEDYPIILVLALCTVVLGLVRFRERKESYVLLIIYFLFTSALAVFTCGKVGSWIGYFLETLAVATILISILAWKVGSLKEGKAFKMGVYIGDKIVSMDSRVKDFVLIAIPIFVLIQIVSLPNYGAWTQPPISIKEDYKTVLGYIESLPKDVPILSEDGYVLDKSDRDPIWEPSFFSASAKNKGLDQSGIVDRIVSKEFGLIILEWDLTTYYNWKPGLNGLVTWMPDNIRRCFSYGYMRSTDEFVDAMLGNYQLRSSFSRMWVYEPKTS